MTDAFSTGAVGGPLIEPGMVSVVVCVRNGAAYLAEALASAAAEGPLEIVVADDGSTDDSAAVAETAGARVLRLGAVGPTPARNAAVAAARGHLIACLDADDRWPAGRLARLCAALEAAAADGVFGAQQTFGVGVAGAVLSGRSMGTLLARREAYDAVGPLDETLEAGGVVDWLARTGDAALGLRFVTIDDVVLERRVHDHNFSLTARDAVHADYLRAARAAVLRRRER